MAKISGLCIVFFLCLAGCKEPIPVYILSIENDGNGTTIPSGDVTVIHGVTTDIAATAAAGYVFLNWTVEEGDADIANVDLADTTAILMTVDASIMANFIRIPTLYVANSDFTITVIHGLDGTVLTIIDVSNEGDFYPAAVGVNSVTEKVYIVHEETFVTVIEASTNTVSKTIDLDGGYGFPMVAVNPITNTIFAASESGNVVVIDGGTNESTHSFSSGGIEITGIAINRATNKFYHTDWHDADLFVYNVATEEYTSAGTDFYGNWGRPAVNHVTNKIYVPDDTNNTVWIVDGSTDTQVGSVAVGEGSSVAAVNTITNMIYVTNYGDATVSVIDGSVEPVVVVATVEVESEPWGVAVSENFNMVYVVNNDSNSLSIIDGATNTVTHTVEVGNNPKTVGVLE